MKRADYAARYAEFAGKPNVPQPPKLRRLAPGKYTAHQGGKQLATITKKPSGWWQAVNNCGAEITCHQTLYQVREYLRCWFGLCNQHGVAA